MSCELCNPKRETEWRDDVPAWYAFNVFRCRVHGEFMIVARHHGDWYRNEKTLVKRLGEILFPGNKIRWEMSSIRDHAHCHVVGT